MKSTMPALAPRFCLNSACLRSKTSSFPISRRPRLGLHISLQNFKLNWRAKSAVDMASPALCSQYPNVIFSLSPLFLRLFVRRSIYSSSFCAVCRFTKLFPLPSPPPLVPLFWEPSLSNHKSKLVAKLRWHETPRFGTPCHPDFLGHSIHRHGC